MQALYDVRCQERLLRQQEDDLAKQKEALAREHDLQTREDAALIRSIRRQHVCVCYDSRLVKVTCAV